MSSSSPLTHQERVEVEVRHLKLASSTHYERLGVAETADRSELRRAHAELHQRFNTMLVRIDPGDSSYPQVFELLRAFDAALLVLCDTQQRILYDSSLRRRRQSSQTPVPTEHNRHDDAQGVFHTFSTQRPPDDSHSPERTEATERVGVVHRPTQPGVRPVSIDSRPTVPVSATPIVPPPLRRTPVPSAIEPRSSLTAPGSIPSRPPADHLGATRSPSRPDNPAVTDVQNTTELSLELDLLHAAVRQCLAAIASLDPSRRENLLEISKALERAQRDRHRR